MKNFLHGLMELIGICVVVAIAFALPIWLGWKLIVAMRDTFGDGGWPVVLAQVASGFIAVFGIPLTLGAIGYLLIGTQRLLKRN